jgi:signal transduction histidine kinase
MADSSPVILNVNDDAASRYLLSRVLRMAGFTVVEAGSGQEALERVDASTDLVVLDVHLPDMDGREVCRRIKQAPLTREVLVLHLSAIAVSAAQRVQGLEVGADAYLVAPVDPNELVAQVKALLRLRNAEREVRVLSGEVERQRRLLELAISSAADPISLLDHAGRNLFSNAASRRAVGGRQAPGMGARELATRVPGLAPYAAHVEEALRTGQVQRGEVTLGEGPQARGYEYTISPALGPGGAVEALMVTAHDITERRSAEEFREQFIGMLGHDLRNPLNAILLSAQQLQRKGLAEAQASLNGRILTSGRRMERMIHQLLDFARARLGGGIPVTRVPGDLFEVCRRCVEELRASHPGQPLELEMLGDGRGAWDADRLEQVVGNLLANAFKHGAPGRPVRVRLEATGPQVVLCVHNEGLPIPPEELPHLFDAYRRAVRTRERGADTGLGLGLYITEHIIRAHGGTVDVVSTAEAGTTFRVRLPR